jgi:hypothetical protein
VPQLDYLTNLSFLPFVLGGLFLSYLIISEYLKDLLVVFSESALTFFTLSPHFLKLTTETLFFFYWSLKQSVLREKGKYILSKKI